MSIELHDIVKVYQTPAGKLTALNKINLRIDSGEFVAIVGRSGSGKSTLLNMLTGIDRPTSGQISIQGTELQRMKENKLAAWRGRHIGVVFQFFQLLPTLTVAENIMLPMDFCNMFAGRQRYQRAIDLLRQVDMEEHARKLPTALSGGQQQRVAIARALANDPPLLVTDEPTGNLDTRTSEAIFQLFRGLATMGKTIVMVTHDNDLAQRADRVVTISDGNISSDTLSGVSA